MSSVFLSHEYPNPCLCFGASACVDCALALWRPYASSVPEGCGNFGSASIELGLWKDAMKHIAFLTLPWYLYLA